MEEVIGSIPIRSTNIPLQFAGEFMKHPLTPIVRVQVPPSQSLRDMFRCFRYLTSEANGAHLSSEPPRQRPLLCSKTENQLRVLTDHRDYC